MGQSRRRRVAVEARAAGQACLRSAAGSPTGFNGTERDTSGPYMSCEWSICLKLVLMYIRNLVLIAEGSEHINPL